MAFIIDGRACASEILEVVAKNIADYKNTFKKIPHLTVIQVGQDPASSIYVGNKRSACQNMGISSQLEHLPKDVSHFDLETLLHRCAQDPEIDAILLQLPIPKHLDLPKLLECIPIHKDVDGFHPYHLGRLAQQNPVLRPCTPYGVMQLLKWVKFPVLGKHAVVVGASNIVGRPMALELLLAGATVTICHSATKDLKSHVNFADILISAVGRPGLIAGEWIKPGGMVIDIGITRLPSGKIAGDVVFEPACRHALGITPVPGGVGPVTIATLLANTVQCAFMCQGIFKNVLEDFC